MADVSRETAPPADRTLLSQVFAPARLPALEAYADLLASEGVVRGLIGPREVPRLWDRHLLNCGLLAPLVPDRARVVDLGSGGGLPGLVLALARPDLVVTLVEPMARRVEFLTEAVTALGLAQVTIERGRAEDLAGRERFDVVTSRALAPLPKLLAWSLPLLAQDGVVLALKGSSAQAEIDGARADLAGWRVRAEVVVCEAPGVSPATVVRVVGEDGATLGWQASTSARRTRREPR